MSATAAATERHEKEAKLRNSSNTALLVKRNASNPRKVTAIDFRPNELSLSSQIKSNKLKTVDEQRNVLCNASTNRLPANQREKWKNSNLFSKTLSSIDTTMSASSAKKGNTSLTTVSIECASGTNPIASPPINVTSSSSATATASGTASASVGKSSEWKLLKYKLGLGLLRKKANKEISANLCHQTSIKWKDAVECNADCSATTANKHEKSPQASHQQRSISPCDTASNTTIVSKRSLVQDEGIVCKSEDLLFLISEASKVVKSSKTKGNKEGIKEEKEKTASYSCTPNTSNSNSTSFRRTSLNKQNSSGSQSSDTEEKSAKQTNVRRANSCTVEKVVKTSHSKPMESRVKICVDGNSNNDCENQNNENKAERRDCAIAATDSLSEQFKETSTKAHNCLYNDNDSENHNKPNNEQEVSPVKWDESNIVDPMIFGNAIQAFLRGLNNTTNEKRVSFKKSF